MRDSDVSAKESTRKVAGIRRNPNHRPREIFEIENQRQTVMELLN